MISIRHNRKRESEERGDNQDAEDVPGGERSNEVVRDDADEVLHVGLVRYSPVRELRGS